VVCLGQAALHRRDERFITRRYQATLKSSVTLTFMPS